MMVQKKSNRQILVGWSEWLALPALGIPAIKTKIDTGARTSALHTFELKSFEDNGQLKVKFGIHPLQKRTDIEIYCIADVIDQRVVRDSGGHPEKRFVIQTSVRLGDMEWPIEMTLTNREDMLFRMLLGRTAMRGRILVEPRKSFILGKELKYSYSETKKGDL